MCKAPGAVSDALETPSHSRDSRSVQMRTGRDAKEEKRGLSCLVAWKRGPKAGSVVCEPQGRCRRSRVCSCSPPWIPISGSAEGPRNPPFDDSQGDLRQAAREPLTEKCALGLRLPCPLLPPQHPAHLFFHQAAAPWTLCKCPA